MKRIQLIAVASVILIMTCLVSCSKSGGSGGGGGSTTPTIKILQGMTYSPASLSVKVNTVINITNEASVQHSVTSDDAISFDKEVAAGTTVTYNCPVVGTFTYHCKFHAGMAGTLTVTP